MDKRTQEWSWRGRGLSIGMRVIFIMDNGNKINSKGLVYSYSVLEDTLKETGHKGA